MELIKKPNKITAANAGWRLQFRFAVCGLVPGVAEFCRWKRRARATPRWNRYARPGRGTARGLRRRAGCAWPGRSSPERAAQGSAVFAARQFWGHGVDTSSWCWLFVRSLYGAQVPPPVARHRSRGATHAHAGEQTPLSLSAKAILTRHVKERPLPSTPGQLLEQLFVIFPEYRTCYDGPIHDDTPTYHSVVIAFVPFFGAHAASSTERQMRSFAALVTAAVAAGGPIANAFDTCLLEHLHQIRASKVFSPYLRTIAREKSHA